MNPESWFGNKQALTPQGPVFKSQHDHFLNIFLEQGILFWHQSWSFDHPRSIRPFVCVYVRPLPYLKMHHLVNRWM